MKKNYSNYSIFCFMIYFFILFLVLYFNPPLVEYLYPLNVPNDYNTDTMTNCYTTKSLSKFNNACIKYLYKDDRLLDNGSIDNKIESLKEKKLSIDSTSCPNDTDFTDYKNQQVYYLQKQIDFLEKINTAENSEYYPNIDYLTSYKCPIDKVRAVCKRI